MLDSLHSTTFLKTFRLGWFSYAIPGRARFDLVRVWTKPSSAGATSRREMQQKEKGGTDFVGGEYDTAQVGGHVTLFPHCLLICLDFLVGIVGRSRTGAEAEPSGVSFRR